MLQEGSGHTDFGEATNRQFAYNGRGELTAGIGYLGTNVTSYAAPLPGRRHEYAYDSIGNRQWSNSTGASGLRDDYTANALNQYVAGETTRSPFPAQRYRCRGGGEGPHGDGRAAGAVLER